MSHCCVSGLHMQYYWLCACMLSRALQAPMLPEGLHDKLTDAQRVYLTR
jgi:hypothetical protein